MTSDPPPLRSARHQAPRRTRATRRRGVDPVEVPAGSGAPRGGGGRRGAPKAKAKGRAGRNLGAAVAVGVILGAAVIASLFVRKEAFLGVMCLALLIAVWEIRGALSNAHVAVPLVPVAVGSVSMILGAYVAGAEGLTVTLGLTLVAVLLWRVADGLDGAISDVSAGLFASLYPCFLAGFASLMLAAPDGEWRIVTFILVTICSDIGGYAVGVFLGRHPMAPSVSPKKSWEGFVGSLAASALAGGLAVGMLLEGPWASGAVLGAAVATVATVGDLMESTIKRDLGIKDMGSILPGHGGIMDRLDSLLMTAPVVWAALVYLVPTTAL